MITLSNYTMRIYVRDRRCKSGERIRGTYSYYMTHNKWMEEEVTTLKSTLYRGDEYRFEVDIIGE